jgi:uncharacterized protein YaaR (DUF327 family)
VTANAIVAKLHQIFKRMTNIYNKGEFMRIKDMLSTQKNDGSSKKTNPILTTSSLKTLFSSEISKVEKDINTYEQDLIYLRKDLETAGDILEKEPTIPNFRKFRDVLSRLAKRINSEAYCLEKCGGTPQNPRYYETITTINIEADKLYNLIIKEQRNNMAITAKVIGIKGLVVDLIS